jgi:hypothetical protein
LAQAELTTPSIQIFVLFAAANEFSRRARDEVNFAAHHYERQWIARIVLVRSDCFRGAAPLVREPRTRQNIIIGKTN